MLNSRHTNELFLLLLLLLLLLVIIIIIIIIGNIADTLQKSQILQKSDILQKSQILQISQNCPKERYRIPFAEIADIANIAELSKREVQNPLRRNCEYCSLYTALYTAETTDIVNIADFSASCCAFSAIS